LKCLFRRVDGRNREGVVQQGQSPVLRIDSQVHHERNFIMHQKIGPALGELLRYASHLPAHETPHVFHQAHGTSQIVVEPLRRQSVKSTSNTVIMHVLNKLDGKVLVCCSSIQ
jgi:hypothetical protein